VFLAVIRPVESDPIPPVVGSIAALSPDVPTSSVQPDQAAGPPGGEVPWVSELLSEFSEVFQDPLPPGLLPDVTLDEIRCSSARRVRKPRLVFQQT
jgi:hypothetical protein